MKEIKIIYSAIALILLFSWYMSTRSCDERSSHYYHRKRIEAAINLRNNSGYVEIDPIILGYPVVGSREDIEEYNRIEAILQESDNGCGFIYN